MLSSLLSSTSDGSFSNPAASSSRSATLARRREAESCTSACRHLSHQNQPSLDDVLFSDLSYSRPHKRQKVSLMNIRRAKECCSRGLCIWSAEGVAFETTTLFWSYHQLHFLVYFSSSSVLVTRFHHGNHKFPLVSSALQCTVDSDKLSAQVSTDKGGGFQLPL